MSLNRSGRSRVITVACLEVKLELEMRLSVPLDGLEPSNSASSWYCSSTVSLFLTVSLGQNIWIKTRFRSSISKPCLPRDLLKVSFKDKLEQILVIVNWVIFEEMIGPSGFDNFGRLLKDSKLKNLNLGGFEAGAKTDCFLLSCRAFGSTV
ncbi:hypothetical protein WICPIJ_001866 [Wickerhamomyces pijperi]|uniref:Uncharacterized protein n=1 Tax=Wickerhamomyces pijperi TaxID=599730 RepID=A0A9P8TQ66_WICPI|nr:hypothetical protein WICPIJ_001866 [Wickerhamomyces pijperi]